MSHVLNTPTPVLCNLDALLEDLPGVGEPNNDRTRCRHCLRPLPWDWVQDECAACQSITCERCKQPCIEDFARPDDVYLMPNGNYRCVACILYDGTICEDCDQPFGNDGFVTLTPRTDPFLCCYPCFRKRVEERRLGFAQEEGPDAVPATPGRVPSLEKEIA